MGKLTRFIGALWNIASQAVNVVFLGGHPNESVSGRCHREPWPHAKRLVNSMFFWQKDHCRSAYTNDLEWARDYLKTAEPGYNGQHETGDLPDANR